jgi:hypothetical protein
MPFLIDLKSNLRDLKFGVGAPDRPGGGYSGQPYIQTKLPSYADNPTPKMPDFLLRNGIYTPRDSATDVKRLAKMFTDLKSPNGLLFTAKQQLLSNSNVRTQAGGILNQGVYTPLSTLAQAGVVAFGGHLNKQGIDPTGLSPLSLRTYLDVVSPKVGPSIKAPSNNRLVNLVDKKIVNNRVGALYPSAIDNNINLLGGKRGNTMITYRGGPGSVLGVGLTNINFADQRTGENNPLAQDTGANKAYFYGSYAKGGVTTLRPNFTLATKTGPVMLHEPNRINYSRGEGAAEVYNLNVNKNIVLINQIFQAISTIPSAGIPTLNINETLFGAGGSLTSERNVYKQGGTFPETNTEVIRANGATTFDQLQIIAQTPVSKGGDIQDFRKTIITSPNGKGLLGKPNNNLALAPNYKTGAIESRIHLGNPGTPKNKANYNIDSPPLDKINALPLYKSPSVATNDVRDVNDIVKFRIAVIDNDTPDQKVFIHFRAFLDSFSDSYNSEWSDFQYNGRGEKFHTYQGFTRDINLSWTVAAQSRAELIPMYKKLNYLSSVIAPDYSKPGYMRGNLVQLTIGGYIYETVGIIRGFTYDVPQEATWEIGITDQDNGLETTTNNGERRRANVTAARDIKELPHWLKVTGFRFTPIQSFIPRLQENTYPGESQDANGNLLYPIVSTFGKQRYISLSNGFTDNYDTIQGRTPSVSTTGVENGEFLPEPEISPELRAALTNIPSLF